MDTVATDNSAFSSLNYRYGKIIDLVKVAELFTINIREDDHMCIKDIRG